MKGPSIVKKPDNQVLINKPTEPVDVFLNNAA
jgi:hypothetical protein